MRDLWLPTVAAMLAAILSGVALARRVEPHRPIPWALGLVLVAELLQKARLVWIVPSERKLLADPPPYEGWQRVAFHAIEQAGELLTPAMAAWAALIVFLVPVRAPRFMYRIHGHLATKHVLDGGTRVPAKLRAVRFIIDIFEDNRRPIVGIAWACALALLVLGYPELRRDAQTRVYLVAHVASLLVGAAAAVALLCRARLRDLTTTHACALFIVGFQVLDLAVGAWRYGLYGGAYRATQGGLLGLYLLLTFAQARALVRVPRATM